MADHTPTTGLLARVRQIQAAVSDLLLAPLAWALMMSSPWAGAVLWLVLLQAPHLALSGLLALLAIDSTYRFVLRGYEIELATYVKANGFLAALATAWLIRPAGLSIGTNIALVLSAVLVASVIALALKQITRSANLPPLVWGHVLASAMMFTLFPDWTVMAAEGWGALAAEVSDVAALPAAMLRSVGGFFFLPSIVTGGVIAALILAWSRAMFLAGVVAWLSGAAVSILLASLGVTFFWAPVSYNFFLVGMALGAAYFLPTASSLVLAVFAGILTALFASVIQVVTGGSAVSYLPFPFLSVVWVGIIVLRTPALKSRFVENTIVGIQPEKAAAMIAQHRLRWGSGDSLLAIPVSGEVSISQGFAGKSSHKGLWQHAIDFQRPNLQGLPVEQAATIWRAPVFAPVEGVVEHLRNDIADNPLGLPNFAENWGNLIVLKMDSGDRVLLAHFAQGSICVVQGQRVGFTTLLGEVGNSGRAALPHLHMQAQETAEPGAPTHPFRLANYLHHIDGRFVWHASGVPAKAAVLSAARPAPAVHDLLAGITPGTSVWAVTVSGQIPARWKTASPLRVETSLDQDGTHIFSDHNGGALHVAVQADAWRVQKQTDKPSALLHLLGLAAPTIPYAAFPGLEWNDHVLRRPVVGNAGYLATLLPFNQHGLIKTHSTCKSSPDSFGTFLTVATKLENAQRDYPQSLSCAFAPLRGPVQMSARFKNGSIHFEALSFLPNDGQSG